MGVNADTMLTRTKPTDPLYVREAACHIVGRALLVPRRPPPAHLVFGRYAADVVDLDQVFDGGADMLNAAAPRALALWSVKV